MFSLLLLPHYVMAERLALLLSILKSPGSIFCLEAGCPALSFRSLIEFYRRYLKIASGHFLDTVVNTTSRCNANQTAVHLVTFS